MNEGTLGNRGTVPTMRPRAPRGSFKDDVEALTRLPAENAGLRTEHDA